MNRAERVAARVLFWGAVLSIGIMVSGLVTTGLASRTGLDLALRELRAENLRHGRAVATVTSWHQVVRGLAHRPVEPVAVSALGILALLLTPIAAVAATIPAFLIEGDRRYATIAGLVLVALSVSLWLGSG